MRVFFLSDLHYDERTTYKSESDSNLDTVVAKANDLGCDLLICVGDIYHQALQDWSNPEQVSQRTLKQTRDVLDTISAKLDNFNGQYGWYYVGGNHENPNYFLEDYFGYRYLFTKIGGVVFAILCSSDSQNYWWNYIGAQQLKDLQNLLSTYSSDPVIAAVHAPLKEYGQTETPASIYGAHYRYWITRNGADVEENYLATHSRCKVLLTNHIWPSSAGYTQDSTTGIYHCYKRHTAINSTSPYFELKDQWYVDINPSTGEITVYVWRFDYNDSQTVLSVTV